MSTETEVAATAADPTADEDFDPQAAFLNDLEPDGEPEAEGDEPEVEEGADEAPEAAKEDDDKPTAVELGEDAVVRVKVGDTMRDVKVSDLRALFEREAEIATGRDEVVAQRTAYTEAATRAQTALTAQLDRAKAKLAPYESLDYLALSQDMPRAEWNALREMALEAQNEVKYLTSELDTLVKDGADRRAGEHRAAVQASIGVLTGPEDKGGIPGFTKELYGEIVAHAVSQGLSREIAASVIDPAAVRLMRDAMLYRKGLADVAKKLEAAKKLPPAAPKVAKPGTGGVKAGAGDAAMARLKQTGSIDDAAAAFLADL